MNEEQLTNAVFNAMIKFHAYQMEHFGEMMEKAVETLPKVVEAVESVID